MPNQLPSQSQANSLLNLLNPYQQSTRDVRHSHLPHSEEEMEPESPSAMLLRELQGDDEDEDEERKRYMTREREGMSPTPTPSRSMTGLGLASTNVGSGKATTTTDSSEDGDGDQPPQSIMYDQQPTNAKRSTNRNVEDSPGPFRPPPGSSSTSISASARSASTSPGPSTISNYASGLDLNSTVEPSPSSIVNETRHVPTFRERSEPARTTSGSPSKRSQHERGIVQGYLDPPLSASRKGKGKEKEKEKKVGGRKYHQVYTQPEDLDDDKAQKVGKDGLNDYEKALWKWVNVDDLDGFLQEVYAFYKGKGFYCIFLAKLLNLLTTFFVIGFSTFLLSCIDYPKLWSTTGDTVGRLDDVLIEKCLISGSIPHMLFILTILVVYAFQLFTFLMSIPRLLELHRFYEHLLGVPDIDIQTLPWPTIVHKIGEIRKHNPITSLSNDPTLREMAGEETGNDNINVKKLDAHDVANRILRQENYLIALFNKDLLDLRFRFPLPNFLSPHIPIRFQAPLSDTSIPTNSSSLKDDRKYLSFGENTLTKALEWNLRYCLMGYLFDRRGQVRKEFVKERRRKDLVDGLKRRFVFMGCLNLIFSPFIVIYLLVYSFFRYFEEYHKNPSFLGSRQYTPYAQWKFREFNELPHLFERRLDRSYPVAKEYIDQFPKERTALVMRFIAFIAGSFAAILLSASLVDPDLFLHFEITPHRTILFYLGIFGSILAVARGMVPEENLVFDPESTLREVVWWTHYLPGGWRGKLHSKMVHTEFSTMFQLKITVFFTELLSVLLTPWILFFSLPPCSATIIDFFREFTVHVDGIGYVCSFAVFDFQLHNNGDNVNVDNDDVVGVEDRIAPASTTGARKRQQSMKQGGGKDFKMEKSFLHFKATHPDWQPDLNGSIFLDKVSKRTPHIKVKSNSHERSQSRSYDRASRSHVRSRHRPREREMATMLEDEEEEDGWDNRQESGSEEEGFMKDAGMVGLLQQVMKR